MHSPYLLIFALVLASLSVQNCRANWPEPLDTQPISQALVNFRKHQRDALAEFALKAAQQAHDRGLSHTKAAGAQHLDLESMD